MEFHVIPECYADTTLIKTIVPPITNQYNHQKGCNSVIKVMKEKLGDEFALGIIDRDKRRLEYEKEFNPVHNVNEQL